MTKNHIVVISAVFFLVIIIAGMMLYRSADSDSQDSALSVQPVLPVKNSTQKAQNREVVALETTVGKLPSKEGATEYSSNLEPGEIPGNLREVCGITGDANLDTRLHALQKSGPQLAVKEADILSQLLESKYRSFSLNRSQEYVLVNEVLELLQKQSIDIFDFGHFARRVIMNANEDEVVRDYAVQHLGIWYANQPYNKETEDIFWKALEIKDAAIAGTSLLALHRLTGTHAQIDSSRLADAALNIIRNGISGTASQVTALRICVAMKAPGTLEYAYNVVTSKKSLPLRLSAVAALGELGDVDTGKLLQELVKSGDLQIKTASEAAIIKLNQKRDS